jgi:hypothetical protein
VDAFSEVFQLINIFVNNILYPVWMLHVRPASYLLILSHQQYFAESTNCELAAVTSFQGIVDYMYERKADIGIHFKFFLGLISGEMMV